MVLAQVAVNEKSNEITAIPELLKLLALDGCIVTIDAMGTQKAIAAQIIEQQGDYALALKDNQGTLYEDVKDTFLLAQKEGFRNTSHQFAEKTEKNHGRVETRKHWMIDDETCLTSLNSEGKWKGLRAIGMVESERRIGREVTIETRYYILSFAKDVHRFATSVRSHWGISPPVKALPLHLIERGMVFRSRSPELAQQERQEHLSTRNRPPRLPLAFVEQDR